MGVSGLFIPELSGQQANQPKATSDSIEHFKKNSFSLFKGTH